MYFNAIDNRPEHGSFTGSLTPDSIVVLYQQDNYELFWFKINLLKLFNNKLLFNSYILSEKMRRTSKCDNKQRQDKQ